MVNLIQRNEDQLQQQLEMFWKTDYGDSLVSNKKSMSIVHSQALKIVETTAIKVEEHYQIASPWRCSPANVQKNRLMAETRLRLLKNRLQDAEVCKKYVEVVDGYVRKGHARRVPENELKANEGLIWCLPHNAVVHPQKPEKVRVVFD